MSADREVVGTKEPVPAQAGVAAAVVPPTSVVDLHDEATHALCANCGVALTGPYCWNCGQRAEHPVHSLWHFVGEAAEDLTHADSRLWGTIGALLFKPGFLTNEFLAGRRVRYLPPLRLYLVMSVVLFLFVSISPDHGPTPADRAEIYRQTGHRLPPNDQLLRPGAALREQTRAKCAKLDARMEATLHLGLIQSAVRSVVHKTCMSAAEDNGRSMGEAFMHSLPKALFMTLPIMAAFMKLLYRRPMRYYVEHLLFLLHNYAFVFLWFSIVILLGWIITTDVVMEPLAVVLTLYPLYYYFRAMRRVYPQGLGTTVAKFTLLSFTYLIVAAFALVAAAVYSVLAH